MCDGSMTSAELRAATSKALVGRDQAAVKAEAAFQDLVGSDQATIATGVVFAAEKMAVFQALARSRGARLRSLQERPRFKTCSGATRPRSRRRPRSKSWPGRGRRGRRVRGRRRRRHAGGSPGWGPDRGRRGRRVRGRHRHHVRCLIMTSSSSSSLSSVSRIPRDHLLMHENVFRRRTEHLGRGLVAPDQVLKCGPRLDCGLVAPDQGLKRGPRLDHRLASCQGLEPCHLLGHNHGMSESLLQEEELTHFFLFRRRTEHGVVNRIRTCEGISHCISNPLSMSWQGARLRLWLS